MSGKQITELESTNVFAEGDLLLTRKTTSGTDKKINYTDLIESIGNPAIDGFVATAHPTESNTIILTPANGAKIPRYFVGMKISFVSPITTTGNVKIKVGSLVSKDFVQYQTTVTVELQVDDYVEGVFIGDKFHRVNDLRSVANIYSNEYNVILTTIDPSKQFTTLNLVSSIGLAKQSYYDGMAISFITPENTEGVTLIHIDGIVGTKTIFEPDPEDFISLPLYANQIVRAIYKTAQGGFIKDRFNVEDPTVIIPVNVEPQIPPTDPDEPPKEVVIIIPPQNLDTFTVASVGTADYPNLKVAIADLVERYGVSGGGRKITLQIKYVLVDVENTLVIIDDYSWITLEGKYTFTYSNILYTDVIAIQGNNHPTLFSMRGSKAKCFSIKEGSTIVTTAQIIMFRLDEGAALELSGVIIKDVTSELAGGTRYIIYVQSKIPCKVNLKNCTLDGGDIPIYLQGCNPCVITNTYIRNYRIAGRVGMGGIVIAGRGGNDGTCHNKLELTSSSILGTGKTTSDNTNIAFDSVGCHNIVKQTNSQAKSNFVPSSGIYDVRGNEYTVVGSQDVVG